MALVKDPQKARVGDGAKEIAFKDPLDDDRRAKGVVILDNDGNQSFGAVISSYKISEIDADASPNYYGFENAVGGWYILEETISVGADTYRYIKGDSDLATSWGNRAVLSYDTFANTF